MDVFVDASAIVAMIAREPEAKTFADRLSRERGRCTSPIAVWEAVRGVARVRGVELDEAQRLVREFLRDGQIDVTTIEPEDADRALEAHARFGKGVHAAALNMGDCFACACARRHDAAILFKGEDFAQTDLPDATLI